MKIGKIAFVVASLIPVIVQAEQYIVRAPLQVELGEWHISYEYSDWVNSGEETNCTPDITENDVYFGKVKEQIVTCYQAQEQVKTKVRTNSLGEEIREDQKIARSIPVTHSGSITGTYKASSCRTALEFDSELTSGVTKLEKFDAYCDMETHGGGWTLVVAQFENDPATNWSEGIQSDYNPSLSSGRSFSFSNLEIPAHSQLSMGQSSLIGMKAGAEFFEFNYSSGDITKTKITSNLGRDYYIHRNLNSFYGWHDPDDYELSSYPDWNNTFTIERIALGSRAFTWAFSPLHSIAGARGYSFNGVDYQGSPNVGAWTIWVR